MPLNFVRIAAVGLVLAGFALIATLIMQDEAAAQGLAGFSLPAQATEVAPGIFALGEREVDGVGLEGYAILHPSPRALPAKGGNGGGKGGGKPGGGSSKCFSALARGAVWKNIEDYGVQEAAGRPTLVPLVQSGIDVSHDSSPRQIFGNYNSNVVVDGIDTTTVRGKNEVLWGPIAEPGVIAVTITWGVFSGPTRFRYLAEWDMLLDDDASNWDWGIAPAHAIDTLSIVTHELGHALGLGHSDVSCTAETMHRWYTSSSIAPRDLAAGDIAGLQNLYG